MNYYFLGASLPELQIGYPSDINFEDFDFLLKLNLLEEDYNKLKAFRRFYDIQNIRQFWKGATLDYRANLNENELEDALLTRSGLPEYVFAFLDKYDSEEERLKHFPALVAAYFHEEKEGLTPFMTRLLEFERDWRLVFAGFRAKRLDRDLSVELQYEDPQDDLIAQILAQKDAKIYEPPSEFEELKPLFEEHADNPMELHKAITEYRFNKLEEMTGIDLFSLDRVLVYMSQLILVEKWLELDKKIGKDYADQLVKGTA